MDKESIKSKQQHESHIEMVTIHTRRKRGKQNNKYFIDDGLRTNNLE